MQCAKFSLTMLVASCVWLHKRNPSVQMPVSPRSIPPPMSPSQRRAKFGLGSLLNSEPGLTAQEAAFMPAAGREAVELQHQVTEPPASPL